MIYNGYYQDRHRIIEIVADTYNVLSLTFVTETKEVHYNNIIKDGLKQIEEYFNNKRTSFTLPFKIQGTDFQRSVLEKALTIPYGQTKTYMEIAKEINNVKAIRAVANALAKNKLLIIIPCHRVIGSDNSLRGYAGGINHKAKLLEMEEGNVSFYRN